MNPSGLHLFVAMPCYGGVVHHSYMRSVAKFLNTESPTHLLFIDADNAFEAVQIVRTLRFGEEVVAGVYPLKTIHWDDPRSNAPDREKAWRPYRCDYVGYPAEGADFEAHDSFVAGRYAGADCMLIRGSALQRMTEAFPETRYVAVHTQPVPDTLRNQYAPFDCMIDPATGHYLSEHYAFCTR